MFDYTLYFYIITISILALVSICSNIVDILCVYPSETGDSFLQMNRGMPDNYGFQPNPGNPNTGGSPGGLPPRFPGDHHHHTNVNIIHSDGS